MPLTTGTRLGTYEILAPLGAGGMGEVYKANDTRLDRDVAVKVLPAGSVGDAQAEARFDREARAIAALNHPNICALYDVGRHDDRSFLVMELLEARRSTTGWHAVRWTSARSSITRSRSPTRSTPRTRGACCTAISSPPTCL